jgi:hypothetical protein
MSSRGLTKNSMIHSWSTWGDIILIDLRGVEGEYMEQI